MPVPFDDLSTERVQPEAIAWLRFVEEEDGKGIRAALFHTSLQGEPLGFCFTRVSRGEPSERTGAVRPNPRSYLAKSLFRDGIVYLRSLGAEVGVRHVLELITRLKQICNADPRSGESSKLADIKIRLEQLAARHHKALLFSQYTSDTSGVAAAENYLQVFAPLVITGEIPPEERTGIIERFKHRDEHKVLILSLRAGGLGLNLQEASYVFHMDRWWNPAMERQAEDRSHRIGQTVKVNIVKYSCAGTIEERIDEIIEAKQKIFDQLIDDVSLDLSARLSRDELFGLFGLERSRDRNR